MSKELLAVRTFHAVDFIFRIELRDDASVSAFAPKEIREALLCLAELVKHRSDMRDSLLLLELDGAARRA